MEFECGKTYILHYSDGGGWRGLGEGIQDARDGPMILTRVSAMLVNICALVAVLEDLAA